MKSATTADSDSSHMPLSSEESEVVVPAIVQKQSVEEKTIVYTREEIRDQLTNLSPNSVSCLVFRQCRAESWVSIAKEQLPQFSVLSAIIAEDSNLTDFFCDGLSNCKSLLSAQLSNQDNLCRKL